MAWTRCLLCVSAFVLCAGFLCADEKAVEKTRAEGLCKEGKKLFDVGSADGALQKYEEAWKIYEQISLPLDESRTLLEIGKAHHVRNRYEEALASFGNALKRAEEAKYRRYMGQALQGMGRAYLSLRKSDDALDCYRKALEIARELSDSEDESNCLGNMGIAYYRIDKPDDALRYSEEALAIALRIRDESLESVHLGNLGNIHYCRGDFAEAIKCYSQSMRLCRKIRTPKNEATVLENMGIASEEEGDYPRSVRAFKRCLEVQRVLGDDAGEERVLGRIGDACASGGEHSRALEAHQDMLKVNRARQAYGQLTAGGSAILPMESTSTSRAVEQPQEDGEGGKRQVEVLALRHAGRDCRQLGRHEDAQRYYDEALSIAKSTSDIRGQAESLADLGVVCTDMDRADRAMDYFTDGLDAERRINSRLGEVRSLANIGLTLRNLGKYGESLEYLQKALALTREIGYPEGELITLGNLAATHEQMGDLQSAKAACEQAIELAENLRRPMRFSEYKATYFAGKLYLYGQMVRILAKLADGNSRSPYVEEAFRYAERSRARALLDSLAEARAEVRQGIPEDLAKHHAKLESFYSRLKVVLHKKLAGRPAPEYIGTLAGLEAMIKDTDAKLRAIEAQMSLSNPRYKSVRYPEPVGVKEIQEGPALPQNGVLLEYFWGGDRFYLWAITKEKLIFADIGDSAAIADLVQSLRDDIVVSRCPTEKQQQCSRDLHKRLLGPAAPLLRDHDRLMIVPDGMLSYLPFELLPSSDEPAGADSPCLLKQTQVSYVQSATVLHNLKRWKTPQHAETDLGFLCYACPFLTRLDPQSDATGAWALDSAYRGGERAVLGYVPFTKIEAQRIGGLFGEAKVRMYTDSDATETNVRAESGRAHPRYLHFAAHGIFNEQEPRFSGLVLSMGGDELDDGFLEMREIFDLKFNADLVVLSACQTGLGKMVKGEGILGLTRAFMYAGSPSMVVSLWPVSDKSTCLLMEKFYQELLSGQGKSAALRNAKLWLMTSGGKDDAGESTRGIFLPKRQGPEVSPYAHAYHWAPFVLVGLD